jgi:hypothetical protein
MNPAALIPTPDAIPVPWGWFYVLLMVTFLLHILVMNAMLGGGIIALISALRPGRQNTLLTKELSYKWPYTIAFAVNMGVAPLGKSHPQPADRRAQCRETKRRPADEESPADRYHDR